jgi:hypothetical protein
MDGWNYSDFFPASGFLDSLTILPERQAIEHALLGRGA